MASFGTKLAQLHLQNGAEQYGLEFDTWLGPYYQPNEWRANWATFFAEHRIGWQLQICKEKGLNFGSLEILSQPNWQNINQNLLCYMVTYGLRIVLIRRVKLLFTIRLVTGAIENVIWLLLNYLSLSRKNSMKIITALSRLMMVIRNGN